MADVPSKVSDHYSNGTILERIEAALRSVEIDPAHPTALDLAPIDNLHGRGVIATREHVARAGITANMHVLDVGCGVGGPARLMASEIGCQVSGIDLTHEFIDVARELTRRCDMDEQSTFEQGDALAMPYADAAFDHVYCHNVTMNIEDKAGFAREVARVLKTGGRFSCVEVAQGPAGDPHYPLPWARTPETSYLVSPDQMQKSLIDAGLQIVECTDTTEVYRQSGTASVEQVRSSPLNAGVVMGDDMRERGKNSARSSAEGRLIDQFIIAEKAG